MVAPHASLSFNRNSAVRLGNRQALRVSTQKMHMLSEQRWADIFEHPQGVRHFLVAMRVLHRTFGVEAARCMDQPEAADLEQQRLDALDADLQDTSDTPAPLAASRGWTRDEAWGVLYALNGSALGATALLRPGAALAGQGSSYLELMRDYARSGALGAFIRALDGEMLDLPRATAGADAVFAAMSQQTPTGKRLP